MTVSNGWKVLLIDDEEDICEVVTIALEDAGYTVFSANEGQSGVRLCEEVIPHIVITDIRMPKMDGLQVLETVKKQYPDIEVIVVTAFGEMDLAIRALQLDASDFITKPINDQSLRLALRRARERYTARKALKDYTALLEKEKAQTSRELVRTFTFQKNLIESSMDGILACDETDTIVIYNRSMAKMLGFKKDIVLNKMSWQQFFAPADVNRLQKNFASKVMAAKTGCICMKRHWWVSIIARFRSRSQP